MQVIAVSLYGASRLGLRQPPGLLLQLQHVTFRLVPKLSSMHSGQDTLDRASGIDVGLACPIVQPEIVICQAGDPAMAGCIQLGCSQYIGEWIIVVYARRRLTHTSIHGISRPLPT